MGEWIVSDGMKKKDFNKQFWGILGVNHKVYQPFDALNIQRDKQADEKNYNNYLINDDLLSNEEFVNHKLKEVNNFFVLFTSLTGKDENALFYIHQICNIIYNFKIFENLDIKYNYINLFSFQIAYIMEYMNHHGFDTELFDTSMKDRSLVPFLNFCKEKNHIRTDKDLAHKMSYTLDDILQKEEKININPVTEASFQKSLSKWKKGVELPSFINLLVLGKTVYKTDRKPRISFLFQVLLARGFLHINKTWNIDNNTKNSFLISYQKFRKEIKPKLKSNNVIELQKKYLLNISEKIDTEKSMSEVLNIIGKEFQEFVKNYFNNDELININIPNREEIIKLFNEKKYDESLNLINSLESKNNLEQILVNKANCMIEFIISIKLNNKSLIKKSFKDMDRHVFGGLLSFVDRDTKYSSQKHIEVLKNSHSLVDCIEDIGTYLDTNYQL